ncbi:MAG TPA: hypothetical protein VD793_02780 [Gemmatimonadales bacterium]|nr:hypothetical protein [Gemmatimonadales bacterium]
MRLISKATLAGLAASVVTACEHPAPDPTAPELSLVPAGAELQRLRVDVTTWADLATSIPVELVTPEAAGNIGPGSAIIITIPDEGRFGCTANFVWASGGKRYLGAAGHCFIPADRAATHGPDADYDASGVTVEVCVEGCEGNFRTNQLTGTWVALGHVAYARQTLAGQDVGNDFGVVEIPKKIRDFIRLDMPVWGGPTGVQALSMGDYACHYGHGLGVGEVFLTKARIGVGGGSDDDAWMGDFAGAFGDSGSGLVGCVNDGVGSFAGTGAIGVLTHVGIGVDESTGEHGTIFGTTVARAIRMGTEAGLRLSLLLP